ncbi:MAG: IreB family regulatory phosphoprotein [Defluviitaleaceae bacterium]|nr:IreB family regulatory phosphoprotein [Defluviitaleaceae bacterium]
MKTTKLSLLGPLTEFEGAKIIKEVYNALEEKGYDPVRQIVGYLISEDPTYITSHKNARSIITKVERDEILEVLLVSYIKNL